MTNPVRDFRKEVESHSSSLTNLLVIDIKKAVIKTGFIAMTSKPTPFTRLDFFSAILEYFLETKDIYDTDDQEAIERHIKRANQIAANVRVTGQPRDMENLLQICISLQYSINAALQKKGYFFRLGKHDVKGIDAALEMFGEDIWEE